MTKAIILCGLPGSGKSTFARKLQEEIPNLIRINRDSIRDMVCLGYNKVIEENIVKATQLKIAGLCHVHEYPILIDDTNLNKDTFNAWLREFHSFGFTNDFIKIYYINTSVNECIERDKSREKSVGQKVIEDMYERNKTFIQELINNPDVIKV